jgi:hypothetical protein
LSRAKRTASSTVQVEGTTGACAAVACRLIGTRSRLKTQSRNVRCCMGVIRVKILEIKKSEK